MEEKLRELAQNDEFLNRWKETKSAEEGAALFAEFGVEVSAEELDASFAPVPDGELEENALEDVAGGRIRFPWFPILRPIVW